MTPTPPSHSSFADSFRFRPRRQRHPSPYDPPHNTTPTQTHTQPPVTPLIDEDDGDGDGAADDLSEVEVEDEEAEEDVEADIDDEPNDAEEEEGGIEEGLFHTSIHSLSPTGDLHAVLLVFPASIPWHMHKHASSAPLGPCTGSTTPHSRASSCAETCNREPRRWTILGPC
jgi:hypothetical protein